MTQYSQRDVRWSWKKLGWSNTTIGGYGCAITALGNMVNKRPDEVNEILKRGGGFLYGNLVIWSKACQLLGLNWKGQSAKALALPTIMQVRGSGFPMHFVVALGNNQIIDSWDGKQKYNPYTAVLYDNCVGAIVVPPPTAPATFSVRVDKAVANVRSLPKISAPLAGSKTLKRGDTFSSVGLVTGDSVGGNSQWYKSTKGNFVWSGGLTRL